MLRIIVTCSAAAIGALIGFAIPFYLYLLVSWEGVGIYTLVSIPLLIVPFSLMGGVGSAIVIATIVWDAFNQVTNDSQPKKS